jgi:hypothetical protein
MNIPNEIELRSPKEINSYNRDNKKQYYLDLIRKLLKANPEGLTAAQIGKGLNEINKKYRYNSETLTVYLNQLVAMRETYTVPFGNATVYRYNGRLLHSIKDRFFQVENHLYYLYEIDNPNLNERFVLIQERERNSYGIEKATGGIMIPKRSVEEFLGSVRSSLIER